MAILVCFRSIRTSHALVIDEKNISPWHFYKVKNKCMIKASECDH